MYKFRNFHNFELLHRFDLTAMLDNLLLRSRDMAIPHNDWLQLHTQYICSYNQLQFEQPAMLTTILYWTWNSRCNFLSDVYRTILSEITAVRSLMDGTPMIQRLIAIESQHIWGHFNVHSLSLLCWLALLEAWFCWYVQETCVKEGSLRQNI